VTDVQLYFFTNVDARISRYISRTAFQQKQPQFLRRYSTLLSSKVFAFMRLSSMLRQWFSYFSSLQTHFAAPKTAAHPFALSRFIRLLRN